MDFYVVKHPLDGLRLALGQQNGPGRVLLVGHSLAATALLSQDLVSPKGPGPRSVQWGQTAVTLLEPLQGPYADLLDEVRERPGQTCAVLLYQRLEDDLPPLTGRDTLRCFWEIRDSLEESTARRIEWLGLRLREGAAVNLGFTLYSRRPLDPHLWEQRSQILHQVLGPQSPGQTIQLPALEVS